MSRNHSVGPECVWSGGALPFAWGGQSILHSFASGTRSIRVWDQAELLAGRAYSEDVPEYVVHAPSGNIPTGQQGLQSRWACDCVHRLELGQEPDIDHQIAIASSALIQGEIHLALDGALERIAGLAYS